MKIALAQANAAPASFSSYELDVSMSTSSICDAVYASFQTAINSTVNILDFHAIDEAALLFCSVQPPFIVSVRVEA